MRLVEIYSSRYILVKKILLKLEGFIKTDIRFYAKNGGWLTLGQLITSIASFGMAVMFANFLPKESYGTYRFVISLVGLLSISSLYGMAHAVIRGSALGKDQVLVSGTRMRMKWALGGSVVSLGVSAYFWFQQDALLAILLCLTAFVIPFLEPLQTPWAFLTGKKEFGMNALAKTSTSVASIVAVMGALYFTENLVLLLLAFFGVNIVFRVFWYMYIKRHYKKNADDEPETYRIGKHFSVMTIITSVAEHFDKVIIFAFLGPAEVAVYSFAMIPIQQSFLYVGNVAGMSMPSFTHGKFEEIRKRLPGKLFQLTVVLLGLTLLLQLILPTFYRLLFPAYEESILYAQIASVALVFQFHQIIPFAFMAHAKTKRLYLIRFVQPAIQLGLLFVLLPIYGILGAVLAFVLGQMLGSFFQLYVLAYTSKKS